MSANNKDYQSIKSPAGNGGAKNGDQIKSLQKSNRTKNDLSLTNLHKTNEEIKKTEVSSKIVSETIETVSDKTVVSVQNNTSSKDEQPTFAETPKQKKKQKKLEKDRELLDSETG